MEAVLLIGLQASGKSTFCKQRFFDTHVRINLDMLKTRHREKCLIQVCLETRQPFVVDNTNPAKEDRRRYIVPAREAGFRVHGYYFQSHIEQCKQRNESRPDAGCVPLSGILSTYRRLELPVRDEGFDSLYYVRLGEDGSFIVEEWCDEV